MMEASMSSRAKTPEEDIGFHDLMRLASDKGGAIVTAELDECGRIQAQTTLRLLTVALRWITIILKTGFLENRQDVRFEIHLKHLRVLGLQNRYKLHPSQNIGFCISPFIVSQISTNSARRSGFSFAKLFSSERSLERSYSSHLALPTFLRPPMRTSFQSP